MSDVTAVVLTIGEPFTERAIASVRMQSRPVHQILVIENLAPFHRALNEAARRVNTTYFLQVDADMVLDPACVDTLLAGMRPDTGIVVAELRDPLMGEIVGIKLFRTECVRQVAMPDTISPDTDLVDALDRAGWRTVYVRATLGDHRPEYTPAYTYRKFLLEGRRCRYRGAQRALQWRFKRLDDVARTDPAVGAIADIAQVGVANGFFLPGSHDGLTPWTARDELARVLHLVDHDADAESVAWLDPPDRRERLRDVFRRFAHAGEAAWSSAGAAGFRPTLRRLTGPGEDWHIVVAKIGLCYGVFAPRSDETVRARDEAVLREFVLYGVGHAASTLRRVKARAARARNVLRGRAPAAW